MLNWGSIDTELRALQLGEFCSRHDDYLNLLLSRGWHGSGRGRGLSFIGEMFGI